MRAGRYKMGFLIMLIGVIVLASSCRKLDVADVPSIAPSELVGPYDALKYVPPIEITTFRGGGGNVYKKGESIDNNIWTHAYEDELGIKVVNKWVAADTDYQQKVNVAIISDDLPDFFLVDQKQFQLLIEDDRIMDLTELYNTYASPLLKESFEESNGIRLTASQYKGRMYGLPKDGGELDGAPLLWIRTDWLKKLGLAPPKTIDEVINIAKAFTEQDPDGNHQNDTFGLNLDLNLFGGYAGLEGFFGGYHAYLYNPSQDNGVNMMWIKDASGSLIYGGIQPEVKTALGKLQELFKEKAINKEFGVFDGSKSSQLVIDGKVGMHYGQFWNANWPLQDAKKQNKSMEWGVFPIPSVDEKPAKAIVTAAAPVAYYVVNKSAKHPEAVIKMLNQYMEKIYGQTADANYHIVNDGDTSYNTFSYPPVNGSMAENNQKAYVAVSDAFATHDTSNLNSEQKGYYDGIVRYRAGDMTQWWVEKTFGPDGAFDVLSQYKSSSNFMINEFYGSPTPTMIERGSTLKDMETQMITKVIMGEPLSLFDTFVQNWKSQGGNQITKEVNDWFANK